MTKSNVVNIRSARVKRWIDSIVGKYRREGRGPANRVLSEVPQEYRVEVIKAVKELLDV